MHYRALILNSILLVFSTLILVRATPGQTNSFKQTNLVSDTAGAAANVDPKLVNPWGIAYFPGQPFWIADNNSGYSTLYNQAGVNAGNFIVPPAPGASVATPTGVVANLSGTGFEVNAKPSQFIYASEDGTVSAWNGSDPITLVVDNSRAGAVYKGLALVNLGQAGTFLLAANFNSGAIDVFDSSFHATTLNGDLTDPQLPAGYAPFGIHVVNQQLFVTYALQDQAKHDPVHQAGAGYVDIFNLNGGFVQRLISQGNLNAPWGVVVPPNGFGPFGGKVLIGEFGNGDIDVFDLPTGTFIDQIKDTSGAVIANGSLWDMVFGGGGSSGDQNTLYISAGLSNEQHGLFAAIAPAGNSTAGSDFSLGVTPPVATLTSGQASTFNVTVDGSNGFASTVTFSCSGEPSNSTCSFSPATVTPTSGGSASTTLTLSTKTYVPPRSYEKTAGLLWTTTSRIGLFLGAILLLAVSRYATTTRRRAFSFAATCLFLLSISVAMGGCGSSSSPASGTPPGTTSMMITATSGTVSHSATVNLTVQ